MDKRESFEDWWNLRVGGITVNVKTVRLADDLKEQFWIAFADGWYRHEIPSEYHRGRLEAAIVLAAGWFDDYALHHLAKPDNEKAQRNLDRASFLRAVLRGEDKLEVPK